MSATTMDERLYTVDEVAQILKLHRLTIRRKIAKGDIVASQIGREYRVRQSDLDEYLRRTRKRPEGQE